MSSRHNNKISKLNAVLPQNDHSEMVHHDLEKLFKQKEAAEKEALHYKEHYMKLKNDMDELFKMVAESSQNKKDLKIIIEQKNKHIEELKSKERNGVLKEEILNATEKLAKEKRQCLTLQEKLKIVTEELQKCNEDKIKLVQKLEKIYDDIQKYEGIQERLVVMAEKQANLEALFKSHAQALQESNCQRDEFEIKFKEVKNLLEKEIEEKVIRDSLDCTQHTQYLEEIKRELITCKEKNKILLKDCQLKDSMVCELSQNLENLKNELHKPADQLHEKLTELRLEKGQFEIIELLNEVENYKLENLKLHQEVRDLTNRICNIETISQELRNEITEKDNFLAEKIKENGELQEQICNMSYDKDAEQYLRYKLQDDFMEKEKVIKKAADEKLAKLQDQLKEARTELHESMSKQYTIKAENDGNVTTLENKILQQEYEIIQINDEKHDLQEKLKHMTTGRMLYDTNIGRIKEKLQKVTCDRDEKIEVILNLKNMSNKMQIFADESRLEQERVYVENGLLREKAYDAQSKLDACKSELESQQVDNEMLQEKLISLDKKFNLERSEMKKVESQLHKELMGVQSHCKAATAEKNRILHEKGTAEKNLIECEKNLALRNNELGNIKSAFKKLQQDQNKLQVKLTESIEKIGQFNGETDKLLKEKQEHEASIVTLENNIKKFEKEIMEKNETIIELKKSYDTLLTKNKSLQQTENENTKLKKLKENFNLHNSELKEKCSLLESDIHILENELKAERKNIASLKGKNKSIENSLREVEGENLLLKGAHDDCAKLEKDKDELNNKCTRLTGVCNKLEGELTNLRKKLIKSKEMESHLVEELKQFKNDENAWKDKCSYLVIQNEELSLKLEKEQKQQEEFDKNSKILKNKELLITLDRERLEQEKLDNNKLLLAKDSTIDQLQSINAELLQKHFDCDNKELLYKQQIQQHIDQASVNLEEYVNLRQKYETLAPKLAKYVLQYKNIKQTNTDLEDTLSKTNMSLKNIEKENIEMKKYCKKIKEEMSEMKAENLKLSQEMKSLQCQTEKIQHLQMECSHNNFCLTGKTTVKRKVLTLTDDPIYVLDTLVSQVQKSSSPAATHLIKSCKQIKQLIFKERGDSFEKTD